MSIHYYNVPVRIARHDCTKATVVVVVCASNPENARVFARIEAANLGNHAHTIRVGVPYLAPVGGAA